MQEQYDAIICGTGMVECVLASMLGVRGMRVLVLDRNDYYGGDCASLQIDELYKSFEKGPVPAAYKARGAIWNVDLAPKLLMGAGDLVNILRVVADRYSLSFTVVQGSYIVHKGKIQKVPITPAEALSSSLMGIFEKRRCGSFLKYISEYDAADPKTHDKKDLNTMTFHDLTKSFGLDENTEAFVGTAVALELDSAFLSQPALPTVKKLQMYLDSQLTYKDSPYVYPVHGLGDLPQAFSRLCAVFNGVFMLRRPNVEVLFDDAGKFVGVKDGDEVAKAPMVIGDPSYFPSKVRKTGDVVRAICLMDHPIPGIKKDSTSCQIILPAKETKRKNDMYVVMMSGVHRVCPQGLYIAIVSAVVEDGDAAASLRPGLDLIGPTLETFVRTYPQYERDPTKHTAGDGCHIGRSLDATSHFENEAKEIGRLVRLAFEEITGEPFSASKFQVPSEEELTRRHIAAMEAARAEAAAASAAEVAEGAPPTPVAEE